MPKPLPTPSGSGEIPITSHVSFVYQAWDLDDDLLYVGVTDNLFARLAGHQRGNSDWLRYVARVTWETYDLREDAERVERHLIHTLQPRFNRADNQLRVRAAAMGHRRHHGKDAWGQLAAVIRDERGRRHQTQTALARDAGIDLSVLRALERCESVQYAAADLTKLEAALDWNTGSLEAVLGGAEPTRLTRDERAARARANAHLFHGRRGA